MIDKKVVNTKTRTLKAGWIVDCDSDIFGGMFDKKVRSIPPEECWSDLYKYGVSMFGYSTANQRTVRRWLAERFSDDDYLFDVEDISIEIFFKEEKYRTLMLLSFG
jgi:hypothetical protein